MSGASAPTSAVSRRSTSDPSAEAVGSTEDLEGVTATLETRPEAQPSTVESNQDPSVVATPRPDLMRRRRRATAVWPAMVAVAGLVGASVGALAVVRHQGIRINGDEPQYLVEAESVGRFFTLNMNPGYNYIVSHNIIYRFTQTPGPHLAGEIGQAVLRHHLYLPIHSIGLSVLLALPIDVGYRPALFAFLLMLAVLAVGIIYLVGLLADARSPWRFALAGVFLAPTYLVASTQVYPDMATGMIIAIVVLLIALAEVGRQYTTAQIVAGGILLAVLPWLATKNILLSFFLLLVVAITYRRSAMTSRELAWLAIPGLVSTFGVVVFNEWAFGHPLGVGNPVDLTGIETLTRSAALLFDRRSGILIQMPIILLGIAAMWLWRRRIPIAAVTAVFVVIAVCYGNGTEPGSQTGGSFVGRYEWPLVPLFLGFTALYVIDLWRVRKSVVPLLAGIGVALALFEAVPVLLNDHFYYSQIPWDPISYRGWWGGLDPSPVLGYLPGGQIYNIPLLTPGKGSGIPVFLPGTIPWGNARNLWGLACVLLISAACLYWLVGLARRPSRIRVGALGGLFGAGVICSVLALSSPVLLPAPVTFPANVLASRVGHLDGTDRVATGSGENGDVALGPFWWVLPGQYEARIHYLLNDDTPGAALGQVIAIRRPPKGDVSVLAGSLLTAGKTRAKYTFDVPYPEEVAVRVRFLGSGSVTVKSIGLAKLAP
jgi:hypothetical protein